MGSAVVNHRRPILSGWRIRRHGEAITATAIERVAFLIADAHQVELSSAQMLDGAKGPIVSEAASIDGIRIVRFVKGRGGLHKFRCRGQAPLRAVVVRRKRCFVAGVQPSMGFTDCRVEGIPTRRVGFEFLALLDYSTAACRSSPCLAATMVHIGPCGFAVHI